MTPAAVRVSGFPAEPHAARLIPLQYVPTVAQSPRDNLTDNRQPSLLTVANCKPDNVTGDNIGSRRDLCTQASHAIGIHFWN